MQSAVPKLRLTYPQICVFMGWFLFQEQNDIRIEPTSITLKEIKFSLKLNAAATKMKNAGKGCYIYITSDEAKTAHDWFTKLPEMFVDKKDEQMYSCLDVFVLEND